MTISNTIRTAGPFVGNGTTNTFPFTYKVFDRSDVLVAQTDRATGVETIKILDSDYSVTLNSDQNNNPGGVITMFVAPPAGTLLAATSNISLVQSLDLTNQGGFYPKVINDALDRLVMNVQQLAGKIGNGLGVGMAAITDQALAALSFVQQVGGGAGASLVGYTQALTGATVRTLLSKLSDRDPSLFDFLTLSQIVKVKNNDSSFDPTPIIQAAINEVTAKGILALEIPACTLRVSAPLRIKYANFKLKAIGKNRVRFLATKPMNYVIGVFGIDDNPESLIENISLSGFTVDGNNLAENGLLVAACLSFNLYDDIDAVGCKSFGINHNRGFTNRARGVRCHDNTGSGYRIGKEANQVIFDIESDNNGGKGALVQGADGLELYGGIENNGEDGMDVYCSEIPNIHGMKINISYWENNGTKNKNLFAALRLRTASNTNIMQGITIGAGFLNISGESGFHIGPNIQGVDIGNVVHQNTGAQQPLVLTAEYLDVGTVKAGNIRVSKGSTIKPANFSIETGSAGQIAQIAEYVFESLDLMRGIEWQPSILNGGADAGRTYGTRFGEATKDGDRCLFTANVAMSGKGTSSGVLDIGGLPFPSASTLFTPVFVDVDSVTYTGQVIGMIPPAPADFVRLYSQTSASGLVPLNDSALPASGATFYISGTYRIK